MAIYTLITVIVSLLISLSFIIYLKKIPSNSRFIINLLIFLLILIFTFEFWFLGPFSAIYYYDEADHLARYIYDVKYHVGGSYLHSVQGGMNAYGGHIMGGQKISLIKILLYIFPVWLAYSIYKIIGFYLAIIGMYLLIRKTSSFNRIDTLVLSLPFSLFVPYVTGYTIGAGLGLALIPLAIYILILKQDNKYYYLYTLTFSLFVAISATITHSFVVLISSLFLSSFIYYKKIFRLKFIISFCILLILAILNWYQSLYNQFLLSKDSSRVLYTSDSRTLENFDFISIFKFLISGVVSLISKTNLFYWYFSPTIILIGLTIIFSIFLFRKKFLPYYLAIIMV